MRQLISCVVLGCMLVAPGLAASKRGTKSKRTTRSSPVYDSSHLEESSPAFEAMGGYSDDSMGPMQHEPKQQSAMGSTQSSSQSCCTLGKRPRSIWTHILAAPKTPCGLYAFVQSASCSREDLCASLGLTVPCGNSLPDDVLCCATKCGYKSSGKQHNPCQQCRMGSSDNEESSSDGLSEKNEPVTWKFGCKPVTVCMQPVCGDCLSPQILNFEDGTDQTCLLFQLDPNADGYTTYYRDFKIDNGGVFDAWANRCGCTNMSRLNSVVSQQKVLTNSKASLPMVFSRSEPFTLISMFVAFSSDVENTGTVFISVFRDGKYEKPDAMKLSAGVPTLYKPSAPLSGVKKIQFAFASSSHPKYVNVDNMLLCM